MSRTLARRCLPLGMALLLAGGAAARGDADAPAAPSRSPEAAEVLLQRVEAARQALDEDPDDPVRQFNVARSLHFRGARGDGKARVEALRWWERLADRSPDDARIKAYHGSAVLQAAPHAWAPWKKGELAKRGVTLLDEAVEAAPDDLEVRLIRGISTAHLPHDFGLAERSREDITAVATAAADPAIDSALPPDLAAASVFHHGTALFTNGQRDAALDQWRLAAERWPDAPGGLDAAHALKQVQR